MSEFKNIESKWQKYWEKENIFQAKEDFSLPKKYNLVEFPYPSGSGMHLGHIKAYIGLEVQSRKQRMQGYNVLFPMGFDAFGLPAENYAMQVGKHPREVTKENVQNFISQLTNVGFSFDYSRIIDTTDPDYYKWTQWIFLKMFEKGLAFKDRTYVNYCPSCKVVLSNEDSQGGKCDRCDSDVVQKEKDVWFLRITEYAEKLLEGLNEVDYPDRVRLSQENWIGKSKGAYVNFEVKGTSESLKVYTTRPDTLFGATFMVIAPEHNLIDAYKDIIHNMNDIEEYRKKAKMKTEFERVQLAKDKTGVCIKGLTAINPVNGEELPIYIADYVMMGYGTGAIMAVPAHDDRDYEFARKFNIPIRQVIAPSYISKEDPPRENAKNTDRNIVYVILRNKNNKYLVLDWKKMPWKSFVCGGIENKESVKEAALREAKEETGYQNILIDSVNDFYFKDQFYAAHKNINRNVHGYIAYGTVLDDERIELDSYEDSQHTPIWIEEKEVMNFINKPEKDCVDWFYKKERPWTGDGEMIQSGFLNGIKTKKEAIEKMCDYLKNQGIGEIATQYKMKDWAFNRQRYWGEPIPIVYCDKCGTVPVPYDELPLKLPELKDFAPGADGESPLANVESYVNCKCPVCGGPATRETDTMPQWAGSSWYYLRYLDPHNNKEICDMEKMNYWMNVDVYNGGAEHITRHMIYSRFWHRFLYDEGLVNTKEPYAKRTTTGLILGSDGSKMSKSKGNTINPDDVVKEYGADVLRGYILFMSDYGEEAPWNDNGVTGINRFINKVIKLGDSLNSNTGYTKELESFIHKTIKKVTEDIDNIKYNTAISAMMILLNEYEKQGSISKQDYRLLLHLLNPVCPHITEELNEQYQLGEVICKSEWPTYDEHLLVEDTKQIAVQVNGKVRATIIINIDDSEDTIKEKAFECDNVKSHTEGKEIIKIIVIKEKIVNIVVR